MEKGAPTGAVQHRDVITGQLVITANAHEQRTSSPTKAQMVNLRHCRNVF